MTKKYHSISHLASDYTKLLYISPSHVPSSTANSIHVVNMCEGLSEHGISVTLYSYHISDFQKTKEEIGKWYGIEVPFLINSTKWYKIKGYGLIYALIVFCKSLKDRSSGKSLVYTRCIYTAFLNSLVGVPFIFENHAPPRTRIHKLLEACILKSYKCLCFVVVTSSLKEFYVNRYTGKLFLDKIIVAPDAVRIPHVVSNQPRSIDWPERLRIVYTGGLTPGKGAEQVVRIAKAMPGHDFLIVGGTKKQGVALDSDIPFNLTFIEQQSPSATRQYQIRAHILLLPNQSSVLVDNGRGDIIIAEKLHQNGHLLSSCLNI